MVAAATPSGAEQLWSAQVMGIGVGEFRVTESRSGSAYAGSGVLRTRGVAALIRRIRFSVSADGWLRDGRYRPRRYRGLIHTGRRESRNIVDFSGAIPVRVRGAGVPATPIPPDRLRGVVDPLTGALIVLRDVPGSALCRIDVSSFDGTRVSRLSLTARRDEADRVVCSGEYRRVAGYSAQELAESTTAPVALTYERAGAMWRPVRLEARTRLGRAALVRRE